MTPRTLDRRAAVLAGLLVLSIAFGSGTALLKGTGYGVRYEIGNMSAPWLIVPFLLGATTRRRWLAVMLGGLSALLAVASFYVTIGTAYGMLSSTTALNNVFFLTAGSAGGALFGLFGSLWSTGRQCLLFLLPSMFLLEPLGIVLFDEVNATPVTGQVVQARVAEALVGAVVGCALLLWRLVGRKPGHQPHRGA